MIKRYLFFAICCLFIFANPTAKAQEIEAFSTDSAAFIDEFEEFVETNISEENEELLEAFVEMWETGKIAEPFRQRIIETSNLLLSHNARRKPHFIPYLQALTTFLNSEVGVENFSDWDKGIAYIFAHESRPLRKVTNYLKNATGLIREGAIKSSYSIAWYADTRDFRFRVGEDHFFIEFPATNLTCKVKRDSITIFNTSGHYDPVKFTWQGKQGKVTWERAGYAADQVYALLPPKYKLNLSSAKYEVDSVRFVNKLYLDDEMLGNLRDEVYHIIKPESATFPQFTSYQKIYQINEIYPDIDFIGGLSMKGANLMGTGSVDNRAQLSIKSQGKTFLEAESENFLFGKNQAMSNNTQISIRINGDSIYHPGIGLYYSVQDKEVSLAPSERKISESPYYDSYHAVSINIDRMMWRQGEDKIYLTAARNATLGNGIFTSANFYNRQDFDRIQMRDDRHPLVVLRDLSKMLKSKTLTTKQVADYMAYPLHQMRQMLLFLAVEGFVFFDFERDIATINDKLYDYIDARLGRIDYDIIRFESVVNTPQHNGVFDLTTKDLTIKGVREVYVSDSQFVVIVPKNQEIILKNNRNFQFDGKLYGGLFTFYGNEFLFDYDQFNIELENIDSINMRVQTEERDMYNRAMLAQVQNSIQNLSGALQIDDPNNKSGKESFPQYPTFISKGKSYIYYDEASIQGGVYDRERFYFELAPFTIDSLDNFSTKGLNFSGEFYSADIFPPFAESIYLRPDNSMGFVRKTPENGFPLYQGKGTYFNNIDLSNRGLRGAGTLTYLSSKAQTDSIMFFPDSTAIHANQYTIAQRTTGIEYPQVDGEAIDIKWYPYDNVMYANQSKAPFSMYQERSTLSGSLDLRPTGLEGQGTMDLQKAVMNSSLYRFNAMDFASDTAAFRLKGKTAEKQAFITENLKAKVDYREQLGAFTSNASYTLAEFPENLYVSYLDRFNWRMGKNILEIESNPQIDPTATAEVQELATLKDDNLPGALFMSVHKTQDSLRFASTYTEFHVDSSEIRAKEVEYINVADASIFPYEKDVTIGLQARMHTLRDAEVIANRESKYHRIYDAKLIVSGRNEYTGSGDYTYTDRTDEDQIIHFSNIYVDTTRQTVAEGDLTIPDNFTLSPEYSYQGKSILYAAEPYLTFDGGAKLDHQCDRFGQNYLKFRTPINPDSLYIPISSEGRSINGHKLFSGSFITKDSSFIYSTFVTPRRDPNDEQLVTTEGYLHYDVNANKYLIGPAEKLHHPDSTGNVIIFQRDVCQLYSKGQVNMGINLGNITMQAAGSIKHDLAKNDIKADLLMPMDFFFSPQALDTMAAEILSYTSLDAFNMNDAGYQWKLNEHMGTKNAKNFTRHMSMYGAGAKMPKELPQHTLMLADLKLQWRTRHNHYLSYGKFALVSLNNKPINRYVNGYFELIKRRTGDLWRLYIELPNNHYYYFSYSRAVLQVLSSNKDFLKVIDDIPLRKRKETAKVRGPKYRYIISTDRNMQQFLKRMKMIERQEEAQKENAEEIP